MPGQTTMRERLRAAVRHDGVFWRRFAYLGCAYGPEWWKRYSPPGFGAIVYAVVSRNRRIALANMRRVLAGESPLRIQLAALSMFVDYARCFEEVLECYGPRPGPFRIDPPATDPLTDALDEGRGAVVVTGHLGAWDVAAKRLSEYGRPINTVMAREPNATSRDFVHSSRESAGVRVIYSDTSAFSSFTMLKALRRNEIVAMQIDRGISNEAGRPVQFFGRPAAFPVGPFVLARAAGAPLIPVFVPRLGRRHYAIRLGGSFRVERDGGEAGLDRVMSDVVASFEEVVREFHTQWFQFTEMWPQTPHPRADFPRLEIAEPPPESRLRA